MRDEFMTETIEKFRNTIIQGDCLDVLKTFPDNSVDAVVTDPPYGLSKEPNIREVLEKWLAGEDYEHRGGGFMGKTWDSFVPGPAIWREVYRVLKPGGHALVFAGTRTQDLMTISLRLAGFEVRDVIEWLYFSGMPKSLDVSKAFDKRAKKLGVQSQGFSVAGDDGRKAELKQNLKYRSDYGYVYEPKSELARKWDGWGTSTKPSHEPIIVASKPKTVEDILDEKLKEVANCLSLFVKIAVQNSTLSLQDYVEGLDSARNRVVPKNNIQDVLSGVTDTSQLKTIMENINWSIALSCLITLGDRLKNGNTSTTETVLNTIIELKTLRYFQSLTTLESIMKDVTSRSGERMNAKTVAGLLNEELSRLSEILTPPAPENATSKQGERDSYHKHEPIIVVRKPLIDAETGRKLTVADCVEKYGTGAINIDACRIPHDGDKLGGGGCSGSVKFTHDGWNRPWMDDTEKLAAKVERTRVQVAKSETLDRFPANCITTEPDAFFSKYFNVTPPELSKKASKKDRNSTVDGRVLDGVNRHPTCKPTDLMAWLVRLVTPPGGIVLDPFAGSGSTLVAARREGFNFIGIEREPEYVEIAEARAGVEKEVV